MNIILEPQNSMKQWSQVLTCLQKNQLLMNETTKPTNPYPNIHHMHLNQNSQHHKPWECIPTIET